MEDTKKMCLEYAKYYGLELMSINEYKDTLRVNFKEYDGSGEIIHKIKISKIRQWFADKLLLTDTLD